MSGRAIRKNARGAAVYSVDWFSSHAELWRKHLQPYKGKPVQALMIGVYEGMCLDWLFENVLTNKSSFATVIDAFDYHPCVYYRGDPLWNPDVREHFNANMAPHAKKYELFPGTVRQLACEVAEQGRFNIVYIDMKDSHHALETLVTAFPLLAPGGMFVLQNYAQNVERNMSCPKQGVDAFLSIFGDYLDVKSATFHMFLRRRSAPRKVKAPCHIEGYKVPENLVPKCEKPSGTKKKTDVTNASTSSTRGKTVRKPAVGG